MSLDVFFFFNDTATTEIYTLSLHDALPICCLRRARFPTSAGSRAQTCCAKSRSEEHTSELQSPCNLVCRLLLEKKNEPRPGCDLAKSPLNHPYRALPLHRMARPLRAYPAQC